MPRSIHVRSQVLILREFIDLIPENHDVLFNGLKIVLILPLQRVLNCVSCNYILQFEVLKLWPTDCVLILRMGKIYMDQGTAGTR